MMNDLAKRGREEQGRAGEIEDVLPFDAPAAQPFYGRSRLSTFRAERRVERYQAGPTLRTCPSPPALLNWSVTMDARDWEQEIEYVIEQSAFGETQRANSVYRSSATKKHKSLSAALFFCN
jgi:hypothetical protein